MSHSVRHFIFQTGKTVFEQTKTLVPRAKWPALCVATIATIAILSFKYAKEFGSLKERAIRLIIHWIQENRFSGDLSVKNKVVSDLEQFLRTLTESSDQSIKDKLEQIAREQREQAASASVLLPSLPVVSPSASVREVVEEEIEGAGSELGPSSVPPSPTVSVEESSAAVISRAHSLPIFPSSSVVSVQESVKKVKKEPSIRVFSPTVVRKTYRLMQERLGCHVTRRIQYKRKEEAEWKAARYRENLHQILQGLKQIRQRSTIGYDPRGQSYWQEKITTNEAMAEFVREYSDLKEEAKSSQSYLQLVVKFEFICQALFQSHLYTNPREQYQEFILKLRSFLSDETILPLRTIQEETIQSLFSLVDSIVMIHFLERSMNYFGIDLFEQLWIDPSMQRRIQQDEKLKNIENPLDFSQLSLKEIIERTALLCSCISASNRVNPWHRRFANAGAAANIYFDPHANTNHPTWLFDSILPREDATPEHRVRWIRMGWPGRQTPRENERVNEDFEHFIHILNTRNERFVYFNFQEARPARTNFGDESVRVHVLHQLEEKYPGAFFLVHLNMDGDFYHQKAAKKGSFSDFRKKILKAMCAPWEEKRLNNWLATRIWGAKENRCNPEGFYFSGRIQDALMAQFRVDSFTKVIDILIFRIWIADFQGKEILEKDEHKPFLELLYNDLMYEINVAIRPHVACGICKDDQDRGMSRKAGLMIESRLASEEPISSEERRRLGMLAHVPAFFNKKQAVLHERLHALTGLVEKVENTRTHAYLIETHEHFQREKSHWEASIDAILPQESSGRSSSQSRGAEVCDRVESLIARNRLKRVEIPFLENQRAYLKPSGVTTEEEYQRLITTDYCPQPIFIPAFHVESLVASMEEEGEEKVDLEGGLFITKKLQDQLIIDLTRATYVVGEKEVNALDEMESEILALTERNMAMSQKILTVCHQGAQDFLTSLMEDWYANLPLGYAISGNFEPIDKRRANASAFKKASQRYEIQRIGRHGLQFQVRILNTATLKKVEDNSIVGYIPQEIVYTFSCDLSGAAGSGDLPLPVVESATCQWFPMTEQEEVIARHCHFPWN